MTLMLAELRSRQLLVASVLCTLGFFGAADVEASSLFGSDGWTGAIVAIDPATAAAVEIGRLPQPPGIGMAYDRRTGTMYTRDWDTLYAVDLETGVVMPVGPSGTTLTGLTFDAAFTTLYSLDRSAGDLYSVDPATGAAALVGNTGIVAPIDLSTDSHGVIHAAGFFSGDIFTVNPYDASSAFVGTAGYRLTSIAFDRDDVLYGVTLDADLLITDVLGSQSPVGEVGGGFDDIRGLAFVVPEPGVLAILAAGLAALGFARRRT